jgi:hypothetical protein
MVDMDEVVDTISEVYLALVVFIFVYYWYERYCMGL